MTAATLAIVLVLLHGALVFGGTNAGDPCAEADERLSHAKMWSDLHRWQQDFPRECDDGYIGEWLSDIVTGWLAKRWAGLRSLQDEIDKDPEFLGFVLGHVDATTDPRDVKRAAENASAKCPSDAQKQLCRAIFGAARRAVREYKRDRMRDRQRQSLQ